MPEALERLINMIHYLPGVGEKTAAKLAFFLLKTNPSYVKNFSKALVDVQECIKECPRCHGLMDVSQEICAICADIKRDDHLLCVVEDYLDMIAIERTGVYRGRYHILGGAISPLADVTPESLQIKDLFAKISKDTFFEEVILAMNPNIEGEATVLYITENMPRSIKISRLSKGLPHAGSIEYADEITLLSAFRGRG